MSPHIFSARLLCLVEVSDNTVRNSVKCRHVTTLSSHWYRLTAARITPSQESFSVILVEATYYILIMDWTSFCQSPLNFTMQWTWRHIWLVKTTIPLSQTKYFHWYFISDTCNRSSHQKGGSYCPQKQLQCPSTLLLICLMHHSLIQFVFFL